MKDKLRKSPPNGIKRQKKKKKNKKEAIEKIRGPLKNSYEFQIALIEHGGKGEKKSNKGFKKTSQNGRTSIC